MMSSNLTTSLATNNSVGQWEPQRPPTSLSVDGGFNLDSGSRTASQNQQRGGIDFISRSRRQIFELFSGVRGRNSGRLGERGDPAAKRQGFHGNAFRVHPEQRFWMREILLRALVKGPPSIQ